MEKRQEIWQKIKLHMKKEWKLAFLTTLVIGLIVHMPIMLSDIPNHDGLAYMHSDQNNIVAGRWFLTIACGISSYYTLPWLIGLLAMVYLAVASVALTDFLEIKSDWAIIGVSGLLVSFPALSSTFAYVFTMDGYMMAVLLAVMAAFLTKRFKNGFLAGGLCLAFSMGIYQSYLAFAILLSIYGILMLAMGKGAVKEKIQGALKYLYMGIIGVTLYYGILQVLLKIQGKELANYQGINDMGMVERTGILEIVKKMYHDFFAFTLKGNVFYNNAYSIVAMGLLVLGVFVVLVMLVLKNKWSGKVGFYVLIGLLLVGLPIASNIILLISPDVTYHALMRYHWILYPIFFVAFVERYSQACGDSKAIICAEWMVLLGVGVLVWNYTVTDNIAYSNMQKKYEKTYAYCLRLLDRIEQTDGYYQGIPIAMIGVVGDEPYPITDITGQVTSGLIGTNGDYLLYTGQNYKLFMEHYLGATLNFLPAEAMGEMYYRDEYVNMKSFPAKDSIQIIDGVMYIKTENMDKSLLAQP